MSRSVSSVIDSLSTGTFTLLRLLASTACLVGVVALLEGTALAQDHPAANDQPATEQHNRFALLVGCTTYPNLDKAFHLTGPANDVELAKNLLVQRFDFPEENVVILSDNAAHAMGLPTRANIERQWCALAEKANPGDQLVVLMAGHGTQTPQADNDQDDLEVDGLDEMFLPRDVGMWNDVAGEVENGIKDDDIRNWIADIQARGANLWVIIDACHSGTMTRNAGDEIKRELKPQALGVPDAMMRHAAERVPHSPTGPTEETQLLDTRSNPAAPSVPSSPAVPAPVLVALYAAQSIEPTIEKKLPRRGDDRKYYGLLTYTLNEILTQAESQLTYRELVQKIHRRYVQLGRNGPTPVLEGNGMDREVLGFKNFPERALLAVLGTDKTGWRINGGSLNGITAATILAVYPPAGQANADQPLGHVRVLEAGFGPLEAAIEPCEYAGMNPPTVLAPGMRCQPVYVDLGDSRLRIHVDRRTDREEPLPAQLQEQLQASLLEFIDQQAHLAVAAADETDADWLLRMDSLSSRQLFLVPVSGWPGQAHGKLPPLFGPASEGDARGKWLSGSLQRIARVQNLLRLGGSVESDEGQTRVEILRYQDPAQPIGQPVRFERGGVKLYDGDSIGFHVQNSGDNAVDVTVLMVDSGYGIHPIFPNPGETNRLFPKNEVLQRGAITATTSGLEHLIVIGVKAQSVGEPVDFSFLAQPTLERARASSAGNAFGSPLGQLFQHAFYGEGNMRGVAPAQMQDYGVRILSWQTIPRSRPSQQMAAATVPNPTSTDPAATNPKTSSRPAITEPSQREPLAAERTARLPSDQPLAPHPALAPSPLTSSSPNSLSESGAKRSSTGGQEMIAVALSLGILTFGGLLVAFQMLVMIMQKRYWDDRSLKMVGLTIIVTAGLVLVSAGYSNDQAAPMMGLLGTVAGYLLGKGEGVASPVAEAQ